MRERESNCIHQAARAVWTKVALWEYLLWCLNLLGRRLFRKDTLDARWCSWCFHLGWRLGLSRRLHVQEHTLYPTDIKQNTVSLRMILDFIRVTAVVAM